LSWKTETFKYPNALFITEVKRKMSEFIRTIIVVVAIATSLVLFHYNWKKVWEVVRGE